MPQSQSLSPNLFRRIWFWILMGLVFVVVLFFTLLPVGIDHGIEAYLKDQGADQVSLEDVDFNPISGRMTVTNLDVKIGAQTVLKIPQATFNFDWTPFIRKRFVLERFTISDTELIIEELENGNWLIGGIIIPAKKEPSAPVAWNFSFQEATAKNCRIKFIRGRLTSDLAIEQAKVSKLTSWLHEDYARLEFTGQLNGALAELSLDVDPFGRETAVAGRIKLKGLALNPFNQLLQPYLKMLEGRLEADLTVEIRQSADGALSYHQKGLLNLSQIRTQVGAPDFSTAGLSLDGAVRIEIPKSEETLKIGAEGQLSGSQLSMTDKTANFQIQQDAVDWRGKIDYAQSPEATKLDLNGALEIRNAHVTAPEINLSEENLNWKGALEFSNPHVIADKRITTEGEFRSGPLALSLPQQNIKFENAGLEWRGKFDYTHAETQQKINSDGQISLEDLKIESPQLSLAEEKLTWQGPLEFSTTANPEDRRIIADGALDGSQLIVHLLNRKLKFKHQGLSWKGQLDFGETNDLNSLNAEADVILNEVEILNAEKDLPLLDSKRVDLQAIKIDGLDKINVSGIEIHGLAVLSEPKGAQSATADLSVLNMQALKFENARLSQQKDLSIDTINLQEVKAFVHRDLQGKWAITERWETIRSNIFAADPAQQPASNIDAKKKSEDSGFRIGKIEITGDSKLRFQDESVSPAFSIDFRLLEARLADLDSRRPEKPATVKLLISDGKDSRISLDGTMQPFTGKLNLEWIGKIESFELPSLSPYVIQNTGFRFISGDLQADIPIKINQNQLEGKIDLILYNPKVERVKAEKPPEENQGKIRLNIPLDSALKLMRDKQNDVKINIPISGDINDPQFSVADAVNKVLVKTLQKSALSYLKYMLGPYGIGISVAEFAYKQASKIRLNPILFAPGSGDLDEAAIDYLQRVAAIMKDYPRVQVSVCGVATESDRATMKASAKIEDSALLELAKNRTERIEDQLVKSHEIGADRIIACTPEIDSTAESKPRADLEF